MSERVPNVFNKTDLVPDAVTLFINKKVFEGWEDIQLTKELNVLASDFQLKLTDKWKQDQEAFTVQPGALAHIHLSKKSFLTGWVDSLALSFASNERSITASGRSRTSDLVDCSVTGENEFSGLNLQEIATKACAPFNIPVIFQSPPGEAFAKVTIQQGETVFGLLDRLARQRKLLMFPDNEGFLNFAVAGRKKSPVQLKEGVNVLSGSATFDNSERFSEYIVKGQNLSFLGEPDQSTSPSGTAKDNGISRFRPLIIVGETATDDGTSSDRAAYEAGLRAARALEVQVSVQGWLRSDGTPWEINEIVSCDIGSLGVRRNLLVKKVVYNKNNSGTTATMTLIRPDAFEFKKEIQKDADAGWLKGFKR